MSVGSLSERSFGKPLPDDPGGARRDYYYNFEKMGALPIEDQASAMPGDVVQMRQYENTDSSGNTQTPGLHTFIVLENDPANHRFCVAQSNAHNNDKLVSHEWRSYLDADSDFRVYRLGQN